jgi:hypothetical protein
MPSRKVRRRRAKLQRHEYEYVIETPEGEEIPVERPTERERAGDGKSKRDRAPIDKGGREIPKPTLQRVMRRSAIFAPLLFVVVYITSPDMEIGAMVLNVALLLAFFIPFSYLVDVFVYRMLTRRQRRQAQAGKS